MNNEPKISEVLEAINILNTKVDRVDTKVDSQSKDTDDRFHEVLEAVNTLSTHMDERFARVESDITELKGDVAEIKGDITELKGDVATMKTSMVTKNYLDDKLYDLRGDLVVLMRKEDNKVQSLVELLHSKKVISEEEAKRILSMELFPQVSLQ